MIGNFYGEVKKIERYDNGILLYVKEREVNKQEGLSNNVIYWFRNSTFCSKIRERVREGSKIVCMAEKIEIKILSNSGEKNKDSKKFQQRLISNEFNFYLDNGDGDISLLYRGIEED